MRPRVEDTTYRELVENASDIVYAHDLEGRFTWVNKACERVTGYTRPELIGRSIYDLLAPEYVEKSRNAIEHKLGPEPQLYPLEIVARDGRRVPVEVTSRLIYRGYAPIGVQGIARDVTERQKAEQALKASEDKFRGLVEQSIVGCYIYQDGKVVYANPKYAQIFGYTQPEIVGKPIVELTWSEDQAMVDEYLRLRLDGKVPSVHYTLRGKRRDGSPVDIEVHGARTVFNGRPAVIGTLLDITERKRVEKAMRESEERYA